jgi:hypothetical protein
MIPDLTEDVRRAEWLQAVGLDQELIASLILVAWEAGANAQLARVASLLQPGVVVALLRCGPPPTDAEALARVVDKVRALEAVPPSPDVAAMGCEQ